MQSAHSSSHLEAKSETKKGHSYTCQNNTTKLNNFYITDSEKTKLFQERVKFNLANPKRLFLFKHVSIGLLSHLVHILVLLISLPILFSIGLDSVDETIQKVGSFSNKTAIFSVYQLLFVVLIAWHLRKLSLKTKTQPIKRYWTAMASNSALRALINLLKFEILVFLCFSFISYDTGTSVNDFYRKVSDGPISDEYEVLKCFIYLLIITFSFRFCNKELTR